MIKTEELKTLYRTLRYAERPLTKTDKGRLLFISEENLDKITTIVQRELVERDEDKTMRNAEEIKWEMNMEDTRINTSVHMQRLLIEILLDVRDLLRERGHK